MRRRGKTGGETAKTQRPRTLKRRNTPNSVAPEEVTDVARLTRERDEALQQQTATGEVLSIIRRSPANAQPVFDAIVESAARLCDTIFSNVYLYDGEHIHIAATKNLSPKAATQLNKLQQSQRPNRSHLGGRAVLDCAVIHVPDVLEDPEYAHEFALTGGWRAVLAVPLLRDGKPIGALTAAKAAPTPFTDRQVQLLKTFADQALIAIENVRLFEAERQRTGELSESLQQQTATSDVLKVISRSTFDLQVVLDTLVESAVRLCEAERGLVFRREGETYKSVAYYNYSPEFQAFHESHPITPGRGTAVGRTALEGKTVQIVDILADPEYTFGEAQKLGGGRATLAVPLLREGAPIGALLLQRTEPRPYTRKQIELVETFADQAVIAIENARLLNELRESLQQQTATADVLKVISRSTFDLQIVLDTLVKSAVELCAAENAFIYLRDGDVYHVVANYGFSREFQEFIKQHPLSPGRGTLTGRTALEGKTVHIPDVLADPEYTLTQAIEFGKFRTMLGIPLLREGAPIGVMALTRTAVQPFTDKQIELVTTFADQAVIAIENVRLFDEVQTRTRDLAESLQQQTATADVLKVISRSAFDLQTVLDALIETATRMCDADQGAITREIDGAFFRAANFGYSSALSDFIRNTPVQMDRGSIAGRALVEARIVQIPDVKADPNYTFSPALDSGDFRTALGVPMLREGVPIGVLSLTRKDVRPFTDKQIEVATTFADQAAIAIENVRLFESVEARTRELAKSLEELRTTQDRLVQTQKLALLGQLTAGIAHEIKNPLNFVNNFSGISAELIDELQDTLKGMPLDDKARD